MVRIGGTTIVSKEEFKAFDAKSKLGQDKLARLQTTRQKM